MCVKEKEREWQMHKLQVYVCGGARARQCKMHESADMCERESA